LFIHQTGRHLFRNTLILCVIEMLSTDLCAQQELSEMSLEQLMAIPVTSVSRRQEKLLKTAAAVYVITQEDIRRSGATDIADVLRMVPGMNVAQISSSKWAVGARGFNAQWENKLLVTVDGRTVYTPSFAGVFWDSQDFVLEDIERIEVIRGPGATMWGANAVNGVISITTKRAADTQGGLFNVEAGARRPGEGSVRYGGALGKNAFYRVFAKQTNRSSLPEASTGDGNDAWNLTHGGFRVDWKTSEKDDFTVDGDLLRAVSGARVNGVSSLSPVTYRGAEHSGQSAGSLRTRWNHSSGTSDLTVQFYYENFNNYETFTTLERLVDFDLQHSFNIGDRHKMIWGAGQRWTSDKNINSAHMGYSPDRMRASVSNAFLQDEIALAPDRLYLTFGTKFERNTYTGFEIQPTARVLWMPDPKRSVWGAVSRAVRTANRADRGYRTDLAAYPVGESLGVLSLLGHREARSENLIAYELGHRYQANRKFSLDFASFYNIYDHLATVEPGDPFSEDEPSPSHLVIPLYFSNLMKGETYGAEASVNYQVNSSWALKGGYSLLRMQLHLYPNSQDSEAEGAEGNSPRHQAFIGSSFSLRRNLQLSTNSYFVSSLPKWNIPAYVRLDINLGWHAGENVELRVVGQNLLNPSHPEFGEGEGTAASAMKRGIFGRIIWRF
jgi:iron complex outermembrane receptor protein